MSRLLLPATLVGLVGVVAAGLLVERDRFWASRIVWFLFLLTIGLGSLFVVALEHLIGGRWSVPLRRVPERLASLLLLVTPIALLALFSLPTLFQRWSGPEAAQHAVVVAKAAWLNVPFFVTRVVICLLLWLVSYRILVGGSLRQDETKDPGLTVRARRFAPLFTAFFAVTVTVVGFDWISSLEPEWYSDVFGVYLFAGTFLAGLSAVSVGVVELRARGRLPGVTTDHLYNLGALIFAFTVFWTYIAFAQYMLIWYANLPEEVYWYGMRIGGAWGGLTLLLALLHFVIPFFGLITSDAKGDPLRLTRIATLMLVAHLLDLYWLVFPSLRRGALLSWPEVAFALFFLGSAGLWLARAFGRGADMPVGDPFLAEALELRR
jgi:hypothetical protein